MGHVMNGMRGEIGSSEVPCGNMKKLSLRFVAERAAYAITESSMPRAVSVEPCGRVLVENPESACEFDMLAVFDRTLGYDGLVDAVQEELRAELIRRKWDNKVEARRMQVPALRKAA